MKTTKHSPIMRSTIKSALIILMLTVTTLNSFAGDPLISFQITRDISGSGLGGNVCPALALTNNKNTFSVGPNFQRRKLNFSGIQVNYRYTAATNYNKKLELYFSGNLIVNASAYMSKGNIEIEESCNPEQKNSYANLQLKVIEGYAGIGLKVNPTKHLSVAAGAGMGMFDTLNKDYNVEMYRQKHAISMQMKFILIYNFKRF